MVNQETEEELDLTPYDTFYYEDVTEANLDTELETSELESESNEIILD